MIPAPLDGVREVLERARDLGFLGPGPVEDHVHHALGFASLTGGAAPGRWVDLGSGGGVPGLVLASVLPGSAWVLLDARRRRTEFLEGAVDELGLSDRVEVVTGRAEEIGRDPRHRAGYTGAVARSFAPPAVVAECGAPLLMVGGHLVVSEPPGGGQDSGSRWQAEGLESLGLAIDQRVPGPPALVRLRAAKPCPPGFPRPNGVPSKRPLW